MAAKILQFPSRDPYHDFTEDELTALLRASINLANGKRTARKGSGVSTITTHVPEEAS